MGCGKPRESKSKFDGECTGDLGGDDKSGFTGDNGIDDGGESWSFLTTSGLGFRLGFLVTFGAEFRTFNIASMNKPLSLILAVNKTNHKLISVKKESY